LVHFVDQVLTSILTLRLTITHKHAKRKHAAKKPTPKIRFTCELSASGSILSAPNKLRFMNRNQTKNVPVDGRFFNENNGVSSTPKTDTNEDNVSKRKRVDNSFLAGRTTTPTKTTKIIGNQYTIVEESKRKSTTAITSFYQKAAAITIFPLEASPTETLSPWRSKLGAISITNRALCLNAIAVSAEITQFVPTLHPTSRGGKNVRNHISFPLRREAPTEPECTHPHQIHADTRMPKS
jgi:hypothetical protein